MNKGFLGKSYNAGFMIVIIAALLLVAGCAKSEVQSQSAGQDTGKNAGATAHTAGQLPVGNDRDDDFADSEDDGDDGPADDDNPDDTTTVTKPVEMNQSTKNATEQHQDTLAQVVADGTYTNDVSYNYHSGSETVTISVTVKDNVVTAASVVGNNPNRASEKYINGLNAALPDLVVGKRIDQLDIPNRVSGSSLTTAAFKQYLDGLMK